MLEDLQACHVLEDIGETKEERTTPPPKVELKPLPHTLKYVYLDDDHLKPVIVNASLDDSSLAKL